MAGAGRVYNLAADMGGMGFIETHKALCMLSVLINTHMLMAARDEEVERFFFSSSACVYAAEHADLAGRHGARRGGRLSGDARGRLRLGEALQRAHVPPLPRGLRAWRLGWPATTTSTGPYGTYDGGREKAPAAICRKVAQAKLSGTHAIEIWGDGEQTRSFMYVDDCVHGSQLLTSSDVTEPLNIGSSELVTINQLVSIVEEIAEIDVERRYKLDAPQGVRGRNSDNTLILERLGWEPSISLRDGMERTYRWIYDQMVASGRYDTVAASAAR